MELFESQERVSKLNFRRVFTKFADSIDIKRDTTGINEIVFRKTYILKIVVKTDIFRHFRNTKISENAGCLMRICNPILLKLYLLKHLYINEF